LEVSAAASCAAAAALLLVLGAVEALPRALPRDRIPLRVGEATGRLPRVALAIATRVGSSLGMQRVRTPATLAARVLAAGTPGGLRVRDWTALKCTVAVVALLGAALTAGSFPGRLGFVVLLGAPAAGFVLPDYWLGRRARLRADAALLELPSMLDLLRVTVEAGRSPIAAMGLVGLRFDGPLAVEWRAVSVQVALGVPQSAALEQVARRLPLPGVQTFVETLAHSHRSGLRLADALAAQAAAARHVRRQQIRERAARAAPKMQLVVALVLVPSVMLTLAAVLAAEFTATGLGLGQ
jgi:tight adherence protein C